jgi:hypothetical protein
MNHVQTNRCRANRCSKALRRYGTDTTDPACLIDFLADARHWCDRHGQNFADLDRIAYDHYLTELGEAQRRMP